MLMSIAPLPYSLHPMQPTPPALKSPVPPDGNFFQLLVLALVHFVVDFYGGLMVPISEPTLTGHLGVGLSTVAILVGGCALLINVIQPLSQWILPERGAPILLLIAPLMAACAAMIGLSSQFGIVATLLIVSAVGIGIVHPEGAIAAHSLAGSRKGIGISLFMSGGYFGFSLGSLTSGLWTEFRDQGLAHFWLMVLPALITVVLVALSRLHRIKGHMEQSNTPGKNGAIPFALVFTLALGLTITICLLTRLLPVFLVRSFPDMDAQGWAGATVFATGVSGVAGMFLWGHLADRIGNGRIISMALPASLPFLWLLLHIDSIFMAPVWAACVGFTLGAVFPICVVLARQAGGLPQRLRMGLVIGGAWGTGELVFMLGGNYVGRFPEGMVEPVLSVLNLCWLLVITATLLALVVSRLERRADPRRQ